MVSSTSPHLAEPVIAGTLVGRQPAAGAKVEHVFRVVKCQFGYRKVRYRGIATTGPRCSRCWRSHCISPATCVRLTTSAHPLPPAAVAGGFDKKNVRLRRKRSHRRVDQSFLSLVPHAGISMSASDPYGRQLGDDRLSTSSSFGRAIRSLSRSHVAPLGLRQRSSGTVFSETAAAATVCSSFREATVGIKQPMCSRLGSANLGSPSPARVRHCRLHTPATAVTDSAKLDKHRRASFGSLRPSKNLSPPPSGADSTR